MLRLLGAGPAQLAALLLAEALWLAALACVLGLALAQVLVAALPWLMPTEAASLVASNGWSSPLWAVPALALGVAVLAALLPAWGAYRVDVSRLLAAAP
jgi:putative ABC transport system permease protein